MNQYKYSDYVYPEETPWDQIFDDFNRRNIKSEQISELIGIPSSSLRSLRNRGTEPKYSIGQSILELHSRYCTT